MTGWLRQLIANRQRGVWIILLFVSLAGMVDIPSTTILNMSEYGRWMVVVFIAAFKATVLALLLVLVRRSKPLRVVVWMVIGLYCAVCMVNGIVYWFYDLGVTNKLITIVGQTNGSEVSEFLASFGGMVIEVLCLPATYIGVAVITLICIIFRLMPKGWFEGVMWSVSVVGLVALITVFTAQGSGRAVFSPVLRLVKSVVQAHDEAVKISEAMDKVKALPNAESVESVRLADVIMIVGESASRDNLSLYGFGLNTSPRLCAMSDSLTVFYDVIGTSTITAYNMNRILTFLNSGDSEEDWHRSPRLFDVLKKGGYSTWWLSNQERSGMWGNSTVALVSTADEVKFVGSISSDDATLQEYDEILLPEIEKALKHEADAKFIGVHLMGSHNEYRRRYPERFKLFDADSVLKLDEYKSLSRSHATTLAEYCNSLVYTDYIISRIIGMVSGVKRPTVVIYFSDHGENVYDGGGDFCGRDERHVEVPFVVYANRAFAMENGDLCERIKGAVDKPVTTAELAHAICTLTGTRYAAYVDSLDVLSPKFKPAKRYVDGQEWFGWD